MKIKNVMIEPLMNFLMKFELKGKESRLRTRFVKLLNEHQNQLQNDNYELIKEYANLDEQGEPKQIQRGEKFHYDINAEKRSEYNNEYILLMEEHCIIDENESHKELLLFIKELILNCDMTFKGREAMEYDLYCEVFESIE